MSDSTAPTRGHRARALVLATVCAAVLAINLDTTIVNVALPSISRELSAGTRQLQWVVDGYNLAFAGLVLAAGQPVRPVRPAPGADHRAARLRRGQCGRCPGHLAPAHWSRPAS